MITRSKLAEQLREYQKRSRHKCPALTGFQMLKEASGNNSNGRVLIEGATRADVAVASLWAFSFCVLLVSSYLALYLRHFWLSFLIVSLGVLLPVRLRNSRKILARKRDLPLSM